MSIMTPDHPGQTVVVGYDGSDLARDAVHLAAKRAGPEGHLVIVHSYALPGDFLGFPNYDNLLAERQSHARQVLEALTANDDALRDVDYETELLGGPPAQAIADVAHARSAAEIVVGSRGLGRFRGALGSVSHEVLHLADRPVVVVPSAERA
jgi:nucleotide-binding universal stress UspA family protein